ncbi:MAG: TauD/TfdA dioxygenase family protein [Sedimentitalea sp.]
MTTALGADIYDVDVRDETAVADIKQAFEKYSVIAIRDQNLTPDEHIAFAERIGNININRFFQKLDSHPNIAVVLKEKDQKAAIGEEWHTDHSYDVEPALGSILSAIEMPEVGGDTVFSSMAAAYDDLSEPFKARLDGLEAWHGTFHAFISSPAAKKAREEGRFGDNVTPEPDVKHPLVIKHPLSGRKCLYVNPGFTTGIDGMSRIESNALLGGIYEHCKKPEFQCRVRWRQGDLTMWDNRATWHKAINDYAGHRRYMHRITIEGCALEAA